MKFVLISGFLFLTLMHAEENVEVINVLEYDKVESDTPVKKVVKKTDEYKKTQPKEVTPVTKPMPIIKYIQVEKPTPIEQPMQPIQTYRQPVENSYKSDIERQQMILRAKYLQKKYDNALIKFENWENKKDLLKKEFREKYRKETASSDGDYAKRRADRRRKDFFRSLNKEEKHIQKLVDDASIDLSSIKEKFLIKYAVPLTQDVMLGRMRAVVENKDTKIQMLNEYINENTAWKRCLDKVRDFDNISSVVSSIEKLFKDLNLTETEIAKRMEQNRAELDAHRNRYHEIEREFQSQFGLAILNKSRATMILENIKKH